MLVSRNFLNEIGLMNEEYFLYCEEIDWITRARGKYILGYADNSIVYHKEGAAIGLNTKKNTSSYVGEYYGKRSVLLYTIKYKKTMLLTVYLGMIIAILNRCRRLQFDRAWMILMLLINCNYKPQKIQNID
jgi:GT2 family glycosyltransferase